MTIANFPNLINGQRVESGEWAPDVNPSNTGDIVGQFAHGTTPR